MEEKKGKLTTNTVAKTGRRPIVEIIIAIILFFILLALVYNIFLQKNTYETKSRKEDIRNEVDPTRHCPNDGYQIKGDVCERVTKEEASTGTVCPKGSIEIDPDSPCGIYRREAEQMNRCPKATILEKDIDGKLYCYTKKRGPESCTGSPMSSYLEGGFCYYARLDSEITYTCPSDMVLYKGKCYARTNKVNGYFCKEGFTFEGNTCTYVERTDQIKTCPTGYELKEDKCLHK